MVITAEPNLAGFLIIEHFCPVIVQNLPREIVSVRYAKLGKTPNLTFANPAFSSNVLKTQRLIAISMLADKKY